MLFFSTKNFTQAFSALADVFRSVN